MILPRCPTCADYPTAVMSSSMRGCTQEGKSAENLKKEGYSPHVQEITLTKCGHWILRASSCLVPIEQPRCGTLQLQKRPKMSLQAFLTTKYTAQQQDHDE